MVSERLLRLRQILGVGCLILSAVCAGPPASRTADLSKLGYSLLPEPQQIELTGAEFLFAPDWELQLTGVAEDHVAVRTLRSRLAEEFGVDLPLEEGVDEGKFLQLEISPGVAAQGQKEELARQGYVIDTAPQRIVIKGNAGPGLLFGVQTFLQLLGSREEASLPSCRIEDWPDLELRVIHWCEKEHQSRFNTLKEYLDRAAEYKINAIAWHLENTFQYKRHPVISTTHAFTREEVRELEEYANERYIELIPMLDFPSHMSFVLKHPEYADLRELPERSYSICPTNEESWKLLFDMFDELLAAFHGKYFLFSTDEVFRLMNDGSLFWTFSWNRKKEIELPNLPEADTLDNRPFWKERYSRQSYTKDAHLDHLSEGPFEGTLCELTREKELVLRLIELLDQNLQVVEKRRYNVEVMLALAGSYLDNIRLFETLGQTEDILSEAHRVYGEGRKAEAVSLLEKAEKLARDIAEHGETAQKSFVDAWMVSRFPSKQMEIFEREGQLDLAKWADDLRNIRGRLDRP